MRRFLAVLALLAAVGAAMHVGQRLGLIEASKPKVDGDQTGTSASLDFEVEFLARKAVRGVLKSPSTADFSSVTTHRQPVPYLWAVIGAVDSQNEFGAMLRTGFLAIVHNSCAGGEGCWKIEHMTVGDQSMISAPPTGNRRTYYVQRGLSARGYDVGALDGVMGEKTVAALRAYQVFTRLPETGEADDVTLRSMTRW